MIAHEGRWLLLVTVSHSVHEPLATAGHIIHLTTSSKIKHFLELCHNSSQQLTNMGRSYMHSNSQHACKAHPHSQSCCCCLRWTATPVAANRTPKVEQPSAVDAKRVIREASAASRPHEASRWHRSPWHAPCSGGWRAELTQPRGSTARTYKNPHKKGAKSPFYEKKNDL
jgi:hypothetical protein